MTAKELIRKYIPHPRRCMADAFDSLPGVQCDGLRIKKHFAWYSIDDLPDFDPNVVVFLCDEHDIYRRNGGMKLGPVTLRAAAESARNLIRSPKS